MSVPVTGCGVHGVTRIENYTQQFSIRAFPLILTSGSGSVGLTTWAGSSFRLHLVSSIFGGEMPKSSGKLFSWIPRGPRPKTTPDGPSQQPANYRKMIWVDAKNERCP